MKVAVLGSGGFLGSEVAERLGEDFDVFGITRENYDAARGEAFDLFVNAAGNSRRYWANENVLEDFESSTASVYRTIFDFKIGCYVYVSSADVYGEHGDPSRAVETGLIDPSRLSPYGFHKYLSELLVKRHSEKYVILRCSALIGRGLKKGPITDLLRGEPMFVTTDSELQFISTTEVARIIEKLMEGEIFNEVFNVGGLGRVSVDRLGRIAGKEPVAREDAERQVYEMNVLKLSGRFPIRRSEEYVAAFLEERIKEGSRT